MNQITQYLHYIIHSPDFVLCNSVTNQFQLTYNPPHTGLGGRYRGFEIVSSNCPTLPNARMYANFPGPKEYSTSNNIKSPSPDILYGGGGGGGGGGGKGV